MLSRFKQWFSWELVMWLGAIILVCTIDPTAPQQYTLCLWHHLGFDRCLGCGLGRSMAFALRGNFSASWVMHPMGMVAWVVILWQIYSLILQRCKSDFNK